MIKLNEEDTQESDNIQQIIKILKSIEDKIKTNKLYRIRISKNFIRYKENIMRILLLIINTFMIKVDTNFEFIRRNIIVIKGINKINQRNMLI